MAKLRDLTKENIKEVLENAAKIYPAKVKSVDIKFETVNGLLPFSALDDESKDQVVARVKSRMLEETVSLYKDMKEAGQPAKVIDIEIAKTIVMDKELNAIVNDSLEDIDSDII